MAKLTLANIVTFINDTAAKLTNQQNNDLIEAAIENTLSRDGTSPNTMTAALDMNSNKVINLAAATAGGDAVSKTYGDANYGGGGVQANADAAAASATAAATSETNAATSATNSATSATNAATSETNAAASATAAANSAKTVFMVAVSDEASVITTGTAKVTFRMPFALTLTEVRASLGTASSSGIPTFDINEEGTTILSTKLTIDANEKTSKTAATAAVISDTALADDAEMTVDIDVAGTGAIGAKIYLIGDPV